MGYLNGCNSFSVLALLIGLLMVSVSEEAAGLKGLTSSMVVLKRCWGSGGWGVGVVCNTPRAGDEDVPLGLRLWDS